MKQVVRAQYRAVIKAGTTEEQLKEAVEQSSKKMQEIYCRRNIFLVGWKERQNQSDPGSVAGFYETNTSYLARI